MAGEVDCAVRPLLVGSLEEGLTMPPPIALVGLAENVNPDPEYSGCLAGCWLAPLHWVIPRSTACDNILPLHHGPL